MTQIKAGRYSKCSAFGSSALCSYFFNSSSAVLAEGGREQGTAATPLLVFVEPLTFNCYSFSKIPFLIRGCPYDVPLRERVFVQCGHFSAKGVLQIRTTALFGAKKFAVF